MSFGILQRATLIALLGVVALAAGLWELSSNDPVNPALGPAERAAEDIALATGGVYVSLRVINAALSAAQEIEVGASIGAQASIQPLKVLEPVDDTIERVADVVFAVAAGAAVAAVGFAPVAALGLTLLGAGCLGLAAFLALLPVTRLELFSRAAIRLGAALGLVLPIGFALGVDLGARLTEPQWQAAIAQLDAVTAEAQILVGAGETLDDLPANAVPGTILGRLGAQLQAAGEGVGEAVEAVGRYREAAGVFLSEADALFQATLVIIAVFALRMLVLPALLLWGAMTLMRRSVGAT